MWEADARAQSKSIVPIDRPRQENMHDSLDLTDQPSTDQPSTDQPSLEIEDWGVPVEVTPLPSAFCKPFDGSKTVVKSSGQHDPFNWWGEKVRSSISDYPDWVSFGIDTILMDTLRSSPRILVVGEEVQIAHEKIIQQDAVFDTRMLFGTDIGRKNDPVGNSLTTGGPPRLIDESWNGTGGIRRTTRRGGQLDVSQQIGLLDSNSTFFSPNNQGNSRLSLSLTQPLLGRGKQVYNERLITQARIDSNVSWEQMRSEVEQRIVSVVEGYWKLYELRCHRLQVQDLLERGRRLQEILRARQHFDVGEIEMAKVEQRIARREDQLLLLSSEMRKQQIRLAILVGSETLSQVAGKIELIPDQGCFFTPVNFDLRSAVQRGLQNRPEIRAATSDLESAALEMRVTRTELEPQLEAVIGAYLAGLNGSHGIIDSFGDQFSTGGPGLSAGLQYEMPHRGRAAKARSREAYHRYRIRAERLRESIMQTRGEIEIAVENVETALATQASKHKVLEKTVREEQILMGRWEMLGSDGGAVGQTLESLLDAQQRRTDAERQWVTANNNYVVALVQIQQAMGTLMMQSGISPVRVDSNSIEFTSNSEVPVVGELPMYGSHGELEGDDSLIDSQSF